MRRRDFITLLGGSAVLWPLTARAQRTGGGTPTVGVLMAGSDSSAENKPRIAAFRRGLTELGWKEGENIRVEYRWSEGKGELISRYARELVALAPDVIVANSTPVISTVKDMTASIPVVFALAMDPVGLGQVKSLARPGGNLTGFTFIDPELIGKWMQLLKDVSPGITEAALLYNPGTMRAYTNFLAEIHASAQSGPVKFKPMPVGGAAEMEAAIKALSPGSGLMIGPDPFNQVHIKQTAELALQSRLPAISVYRPFINEGGLMMYGPDTSDVFHRAAAYVDRVLKGEKPADLPVQQPNKFEFVINLKTAKAFGLTVSPTLIATADEAIE